MLIAIAGNRNPPDGMVSGSSVGAFVPGLSTLPFLWNVWRSLRTKRGAPVGNDPWEAFTLEWATSSPPPPENFAGPLPPIRSNRPVFDQRHPGYDKAGHG